MSHVVKIYTLPPRIWIAFCCRCGSIARVEQEPLDLGDEVLIACNECPGDAASMIITEEYRNIAAAGFRKVKGSRVRVSDARSTEIEGAMTGTLDGRRAELLVRSLRPVARKKPKLVTYSIRGVLRWNARARQYEMAAPDGRTPFVIGPKRLPDVTLLEES